MCEIMFMEFSLQACQDVSDARKPPHTQCVITLDGFTMEWLLIIISIHGDLITAKTKWLGVL